MARDRMVTRTVKGTEYYVTMCDTLKSEVHTVNCTVNSAVKGKELDKAIKAILETPTDKVVIYTALGETEILYGMTEAEFIKQAKILPPRTKSEVEVDS